MILLLYLIREYWMNRELLNLTLLYVEDEEDTRNTLSEVFRLKIKNVLVAEDGVEALEIFKNNKIHFIISDYKMPNMNGTELCQEIKKIDSSIPFIMLSAFHHTNLLIDSIEVGVDKFLQKPVNADKLFTIINNIHKKILNQFNLEKSTVCLQEAEKIALLSYWDVNLNSGYIHFSKEAKELFGMLDKDDVTYKQFAELVKSEDKDKFIEIFEYKIYDYENVDEVVSIKNKDNKYIYIHIIAKKWKSSICGNNHIIGLFQDVSHFETQKLRLLKESQCDPMLNISNKKFLIVELENLIKSSRRYGHNIGVIFFDIDDFKKINSDYGHLVADEILMELAKIIKSDIRQSDEFGRWGGDEFVIITGYSSQESTIEFAKKIQHRIKNNRWKSNIKLEISMGVAFYGMDDDAYSLINRADEKMYEAKRSGKNRYCF